jgi:hypothetical protein
MISARFEPPSRAAPLAQLIRVHLDTEKLRYHLESINFPPLIDPIKGGLI